MTLVLEGMPSSGGPRCLRSFWAAAAALSVPLSLVSWSFVVWFGGSLGVGTLVGVVAGSAAAASAPSVASAPSFSPFSPLPRAYRCQRPSNPTAIVINLHVRHVSRDHHGHRGHGHGHGWSHDGGSHHH
jgi:hypothetical protein